MDYSYHNLYAPVNETSSSDSLVCIDSNFTAVSPLLLSSSSLPTASTMMQSGTNANSITQQLLPLMTLWFPIVLGTQQQLRRPERSLQQPPQILGLELWNTLNVSKISNLGHNQVVILDELVDETYLTVVAATSETVESVRFGLDGDDDFRTENRFPYTMCGDTIVEYDACGNRLTMGNHTITATPYSENGASGIEGVSVSISFELTKALPIIPASPVLGFQLLSTDNGSVISSINDGDTINVGTLVDQFSVVAETTGEVESMLFLETGQVENVVAYSMCGNVGNIYNTCSSLRAGSNATVTVRPFPENNMQGTPFPDVSISFSLLASDAVLVLCGQFATNVNGTCVCQPGYTGDPLEGCVMELPIVETCGDNAQLMDGACLCNPGFEGDPNLGCTDLCDNPSTCGSTRGVSCSNDNGVIACSCMLNFKGSPPETTCVPACSGPNNPCGPGIACQDVDVGVLCYPTGCSECRDNELCRPGFSDFRQSCLCASEEDPPTEFDGQFDCITTQT